MASISVMKAASGERKLRSGREPPEGATQPPLYGLEKVREGEREKAKI